MLFRGLRNRSVLAFLALLLATAAAPVPKAQGSLPLGATDSLRTPGTVSPPAGVTASSPGKASATASDTLAKTPKSRADSVIVPMHRFNHREQIITGSVIMTCLALMLVAMNNYNPR
jgi:hypothetical protein